MLQKPTRRNTHVAAQQSPAQPDINMPRSRTDKASSPLMFKSIPSLFRSAGTAATMKHGTKLYSITSEIPHPVPFPRALAEPPYHDKQRPISRHPQRFLHQQ